MLALVAGQGLRVVGVGAVIGLVGATSGAGALRAFLYQVHPLDVGVYVAVVALLAGVALCAVVPPALRAAAIAPGRVLKEE